MNPHQFDISHAFFATSPFQQIGRANLVLVKRMQMTIKKESLRFYTQTGFEIVGLKNLHRENSAKRIGANLEGKKSKNEKTNRKTGIRKQQKYVSNGRRKSTKHDYGLQKCEELWSLVIPCKPSIKPK